MIADAEFTCPRCNLSLKQVRTASGIFWGCAQCGGRAVSVELLRRIFTPASINPLWLHAIHGEGASGRLCPVCHKAMIEVGLSDNAGVRVDVCRLCHFVWFDTGETESLVPRPPAPAKPQLSQKAREAIAMVEVERLANQSSETNLDCEPPDEWWKQIAGFFGFPFEFDPLPQQGRPWITWTLALAIVAATAAAYPHLRETIERFGLIPAQALRFGGLTFLTSFFLHGGPLHLIGNIYFLLVFGDNVEDFLRPGRYLCLIALSSFIGDLAHIATDPSSQIPCVGASGGIAGVITFYALKFPNLKLGFLLRYYFRFQWIRIPAWFALILWILLQALLAFQQLAGVSSVSAFAHFGGAVVGFVAWLMWRRQSVDAKFVPELL